MSQHFIRFNSRRSTVYSHKGLVSSPQNLASAAGIKILEKGGNCVEAAIAVSAALCITEPTSTGIGGDCFALYFKNNGTGDGTGEVLGLNGTGRAAQNLSIQDVLDAHPQENHPVTRIPYTSVLGVTVPGAIAGWIDAYDQWGSHNVTFGEILAPAIELAEHGFPVAEIASWLWSAWEHNLISQNPDFAANPLLVNGHAPKEGDLVFNKPVAEALKLIARDGKRAFYDGPIAEAIVNTTGARGHKLSLDDLKSHTSTFVKPISLLFQGHDVWEIPPNGHGIVALLALGLIQELHNSGRIDIQALEHNSAAYLHLIIEVCKIGFYDADEYVSDQEFKTTPVDELLSPEYLLQRAKLFDESSIIDSLAMTHGVPDPKYKSDTVYLTVSDSNGEACSFINSVYEGFGSAIVVPEYGFCLQNRGCNFNLDAGSSNALEGGKRPYHTIIPAMITENSRLYASFGNMGGFAQPVCHVQHVLNLLVFNMTPQQLIDSPRVVLSAAPGLEGDRGRGAEGPVSTPITIVNLEDGIGADVRAELAAIGHEIRHVTGYARSKFGRAQIIKNESKNGNLIYSGGSDLRGDGATMALV